MSEHFRRERARQRPEVTQPRVKSVLDNWLVRCKTEYREPGAPPSVGWSHWGWVDVDGQRKLMQVVTTLDGAVVKTVNLNRNALKAMRKGNQEWFSDRCLEPPIWRDDDDASSEQV